MRVSTHSGAVGQAFKCFPRHRRGAVSPGRMRAWLISAFAIGLTAIAAAQPAPSHPATAATAVDPAASLRLANTAAQLGDWAQVARWIAPLTGVALTSADRAEVHRLRGLAAFFANRLSVAESELLAYLRLDRDAHLDPASVPPEAITYFESVQASHRAELRALHAVSPKRSRLLAVIPVAGQLQNGDRRKAWIFGGTLGGLAAGNLASYAVLRRWCRSGDGTCDRGGVDRSDEARKLASVNLGTAIALAAVAALAVYDSVAEYRQHSLRIMTTTRTGLIELAVGGDF